MITAKKEPQETVTGKEVKHVNLALYAVVIGSFLGLVGAGGGFLMIPALVLFANLPMRKAIGTSLLLVAANSFIGFLGDVHSNSAMNWKFLLTFSAFSVAGVLTGNYLHRYVRGNKMRNYFGWFIILVAVLMIAKEISR